MQNKTAKTILSLLFLIILAAMLWVTLWASQYESVFNAGQVWDDPWSRATLFDAYFGFVTFFCYVAWRECRLVTKIIWFVLIMALGNIAMSLYILLQLWGLRRNGGGIDQLFQRKTA